MRRAPAAHNASRGEPLARRDEFTRASISALRDEIDADAATALWDEARRRARLGRAPVWHHGDLDVRNLLVTDGR